MSLNQYGKKMLKYEMGKGGETGRYTHSQKSDHSPISETLLLAQITNDANTIANCPPPRLHTL